MLAQLKCLQIACQNLNISLETLDKNGNFVLISPILPTNKSENKSKNKIKNELKINFTISNNYSQSFAKFYFINSQTPFNSQDSVAICKDKFFCYQTLQDMVKQPKTLSFLDPFCANNYKEYLECQNFEEIADFIQKELDFPLIIKPNSGSLGVNVQKAENQNELTKAIEKIFDTKSRDYDYVMIAQEYIKIEQEFRVITVDKTVELIYQKDISSAEFVGNLSPLHWQGFKTKIIKDLKFRKRIQEFVKPIFANLPRLFWAGIDLVIDKNGEIFLIEINTNPGFGLFLRIQEEFYIVNLYQKALTKFLDLD